MNPRTMGHYEIVKKLATMPSNIVGLHGHDNITEFVLHDLCDKNCFNLVKAGYFVDNPDFDFFKGVAGYHRGQSYVQPHAIWDDPALFTKHMQQKPFNKQVRTVTKNSPKRHSLCDVDFIAFIAQELGLEQPEYYCWQMKHDNHGLLVFEHDPDNERYWNARDLAQAVHLLSLCPVF